MKTTETSSNHSELEKKSTLDLLKGINDEDKTVALSIEKNLNSIEKVCDVVYSKLNNGGRLFYIGSGTSGRLGIVDASECPPTFGVSPDLVIGIIAGGDTAIRSAVENAEDDIHQGWRDLVNYKVSNKDVVLGLSASGSTPYVLGALKECMKQGVTTSCIVCNQESDIAKISNYPIEVVVGPEFVTGSTRMKSGTAQKLVLNMITTTVMIKLGHVIGNKMVDMQLSNAKLIDRGAKMISDQVGTDMETSKKALLQFGSVRLAIEALHAEK